jgi:hypothetical protein
MRKLRNEGLHNLYCSSDIRHEQDMEEIKYAYNLVAKLEGKRQLGKPRRRWIQWAENRVRWQVLANMFLNIQIA